MKIVRDPFLGIKHVVYTKEEERRFIRRCDYAILAGIILALILVGFMTAVMRV